MDKKRPLSIIDVDRTNDGLIVTFSNGEVTLFHTHFLFSVRADDGNIPLPAISVDQSGQPASKDPKHRR